MIRDTSERRRKISIMVREHGSVQVAVLAEQFGVSTQTIRKDLDYLSEKGIATRAYGGAISSHVMNVSVEPGVEKRRESHTEEKDKIGKLAASLVRPGDSIILDSGTTTSHIARYLEDSDEITVVTNDFGVISELVRKPNINIIMLGGGLRRKNLAFYGMQTEDSIGALRATKLFLGVDGFDLQHGVTTHYEPEAKLNRKMFDVALQTIAVTDSSKFNKMCLHRIINVADVDILITDNNVPESIISGCEERGVNVKITE